MESTAHTWTGFGTALIEDGELLVNIIAHCVGRSKEPVGTVYALECILYKNMHLYLPL